MAMSRSAYIGKISEVEALADRLAAHYQTKSPGQTRWLLLARGARRQGWFVTNYTPSDQIYLMPDGRLATAHSGTTSGRNERSAHPATVVDFGALRNQQTPDNERMLVRLVEEMAAKTPRPPKLPRLIMGRR